jgi:zinc-ribbon domain
MATTLCAKCGSETPPGVSFCPKCGAPVAAGGAGMTSSDSQDTLARFRSRLPDLRAWIDRTLAENAPGLVSPAGFPRLADYMHPELVARTRYAVVPVLPKPPLVEWGFEEFRGFEEMTTGGVTYGSTYFVTLDVAANEATHLHELVHVVQWEFMGFDRFVLTYALGMSVCGYRNSLLEVIAYDHQARFERGESPYDVPWSVIQQVRTLFVPA